MNPLFLIGILLIAFVALGMIAAIILGNESERKKRSLSVIRGRSASSDSGSRTQRTDQDKRRAEIAKKLKDQEGESKKDKKKPGMALLLEQGGLSVSVRNYWIFSALLAAACFMMAKLFGASSFVMLMAGITGLFGLPRFFVRFRVKRRQKKFLEEFADALEAMVRLLKAGMPVSEAISMAGREFTGPVGDEMSRIYDSQKIGIPLPEAALTSARRMPLTEMQMFATGLSIQAQTGASLSEVLTNLAKVIRARFRLKRKVQALSSEAKASAMIIGSLPFLVGGGLFFINPDYIGILFDTTTGKVMLIGGGVWMGIGILIMKLMINFKV